MKLRPVELPVKDEPYGPTPHYGRFYPWVSGPPGWFAAGFVLNALDFEGGETLQTIADLGVTLLLFSIGLKLDLKSLAKPEVWAGSSLHMLITVAVFSGGLVGLGMAGAGGFELVGLKADLGALIFGILLAGHPKSSELAKTLMGFKELLLVGFFLTIGLSGVPSLTTLGIAALLVVVLPLKVSLFYLLLSRFKLRARSSLLTSLSLANYSEFGLIVAAVGASQGWLGSEWLVIIALALAATFVIASPLNTLGDAIYRKYRQPLCKFETDTRHPDDQPIDPGEATIGVFGMGRIGTTVYDFMREKYGDTVLGFDFDPEEVQQHCAAGRRVVFADPTDPDFWPRIKRKEGQASMALPSMLRRPSKNRPPQKQSHKIWFIIYPESLLQKSTKPTNVIPAQAGIQRLSGVTRKNWIPVFTRMTTFARSS